MTMYIVTAMTLRGRTRCLQQREQKADGPEQAIELVSDFFRREGQTIVYVNAAEIPETEPQNAE